MCEIKATLKDDKKEKLQSHEAIVDFSDGGASAYFSIYANGYGKNKEEAMYELKNALMNLTGLIKIFIDKK